MKSCDSSFLIARLSPFVLALMLLLLSSAFAQTARKQKSVLSVSHSNILSQVSQRAKQTPSLSADDLAAYGNDLIARKGFDYQFDVCDILNARDRTRMVPGKFARTYQMTSIDGGRLTFRFTIENLVESLCSECWTLIPSLQVTNSEITLLAEGRRHRVRRTPVFHLNEVQLVDDTLKNVSRTWQLPYQAMPVGISADGTKLYVDFYTEHELEPLVLEVSENGLVQFRDRAVIKSDKGKLIEDHPKDPSNVYRTFMIFRVGEKTYRLKFSAPCT